jgi:hypothetical protein
MAIRFARVVPSLMLLICAALLPPSASAQSAAGAVLNVAPTSVSVGANTGQDAPLRQ